MKECFIPKRFNSNSKVLIPKIESIMVDYGQQGYDLTVRQMHYRLNALHPELYPNTLKSYKMLVGILTNGRYAGILDWSTFVDRGRIARRSSSWPTIKDFFKDVPYFFQFDKWADQPYHIELMAEKDAMTGICAPLCEELDISFTANKGYTSSSAIYKAAKRFRAKHLSGKKCVLLYIGDHDPSGIDMSSDITERLQLLAGQSYPDRRATPLEAIKIERLALNMDQVKKYELQENFAKDSDARTPAYQAQFGDSCWELDALDPHVIVEIVKSRVEGLRDTKLWDLAFEKEKSMVEEIKKHLEKFGKKPRNRKKK